MRACPPHLVALGGERDHAAAFALGLHALQLFPTLVMGGLFLLRFRRRQIAAAAHVAAHPSEVEEAALGRDHIPAEG